MLEHFFFQQLTKNSINSFLKQFKFSLVSTVPVTAFKSTNLRFQTNFKAPFPKQ